MTEGGIPRFYTTSLRSDRTGTSQQAGTCQGRWLVYIGGNLNVET
jgi:hypothetical protein